VFDTDAQRSLDGAANVEEAQAAFVLLVGLLGVLDDAAVKEHGG